MELTMGHFAGVLYTCLRNLLVYEEGQDLVEYALVVALIAFGAVAGMGFLASGINNAYSGIATQVPYAQ